MNLPTTCNSDGEFSLTIKDTSHVSLIINSTKYGRLSQELIFNKKSRFYFFTIKLAIHKKREGAVVRDTTKGIPWIITGNITNSRTDTEIKSDSIFLYFDTQPITIYKHNSFNIETKLSGEHTFKLKIKGYHTIYEKIILTEKEKRIYYPISTTELKYTNIKREMIVTADAEPLHKTTTTATISLTRKELQHTAATITDPVRVLQTLPGVASESDASARPIVRGGDVLESRIFIDGIPLIQPYHFGGAKSIFNQSAIDNLTIYKSGFPSKYNNAQSAIITVNMRNALADTVVFLGEVTPLQYNAYVSFPLIKNKLALYLSTQGSYTNAIFKAGWAAFSRIDPYMKEEFKNNVKSFNLPDYQDFGGGLQYQINDKLRLTVNERYCSDRVNFIYNDTVVNTTYNYDSVYYYYDTLGEKTYFYHNKTDDEYINQHLRDTSFSVAVETYPFTPYNDGYETIEEQKKFYEEWTINSSQPITFADDTSFNTFTYSSDPQYSSYSQSDPYLSGDTVLDYHSYYNLLHTTLTYTKDTENQIDFKVAWQKRWWKVNFPDDFSDYITESKFNADINQFNFITDWTNTSHSNHIFNSGIQFDLTKAQYDVYTPRAIHEIITKGNTNFGDFWGPVTGDSGLDLTSSTESNYSAGPESMVERMLIAYKGDKLFLNGSLFFEDLWNINDKWNLTYGGRLEVSSVDTSITLSPRISSNYSINSKNELTTSVGLYTQNNYDLATMALSEVLKPEKVVHADIGLKSRLLPWLTQSVNLYGKYYYDLASERIEQNRRLQLDSITGELEHYAEVKYPDKDFDEINLVDLYNSYLIDKGATLYQSHYSNSGQGYAYGIEYMLQYNPKTYWNGWLSCTLQNSKRQRHPGWRWHTFPFNRPLMISWVNYYRLPRKYEIGLKYRFMLGMPYTETDFTEGITIGPYNAKQYAPYSRLDIRIAKGFETKHSKAHFFFEGWNIMNKPNAFHLDKESKKLITTGFDLPSVAIFIGGDWEF